MERDLEFLNLDGLKDHLKEELLMYINPSAKGPWVECVELPWNAEIEEIKPVNKVDGSFLNVHAPAFESHNVTMYGQGDGALSENVTHYPYPSYSVEASITPTDSSQLNNVFVPPSITNAASLPHMNNISALSHMNSTVVSQHMSNSALPHHMCNDTVQHISNSPVSHHNMGSATIPRHINSVAATHINNVTVPHVSNSVLHANVVAPQHITNATMPSSHLTEAKAAIEQKFGSSDGSYGVQSFEQNIPHVMNIHHSSCYPDQSLFQNQVLNSVQNTPKYLQSPPPPSPVLQSSAVSLPPRPPFPNSDRPFKLNPTVSTFVPLNIPGFVTQTTAGNFDCKYIETKTNSEHLEDMNCNLQHTLMTNGMPQLKSHNLSKQLTNGDEMLHMNERQNRHDMTASSALNNQSHLMHSKLDDDGNKQFQPVNSVHSPDIQNEVTPLPEAQPLQTQVHVTQPAAVQQTAVTQREEVLLATNGVPESIQQEEASPSLVEQSPVPPPTVVPKVPVMRSFADVLKSKCDRTTNSLMPTKLPQRRSDIHINNDVSANGCEVAKMSLEDDKLALSLGRHLHQLQLNFTPVYLQPRGLINRRNWCYINATLQSLFACSPFYTLLRDLPIGPALDRGKSCTPVIDSMVSLAYEFSAISEPQEELQPGESFQPLSAYEMFGALKSECLKGQQEDAEEFLSYVLNGMHEEMVAVIKYYKSKYNLNKDEMKPNGHIDASDSEEEWQLIGAKQRGMVTRKVVEHRTPISDLLGGQIKSLLMANGSKTSASVQPFFTLQLDIQAENVTSVEEALSQMTVKEPIQGYTCAKTKQEVEAHSQIMLQKLPSILILHLKRFVYNKNGGCKKVMKHTEYPITLDLRKEFFSAEVRKMKIPTSYKLFAVMYHDGEEAIKGHYISDIYHHGTNGWIRCDDRIITSITEAQVLSHSPPRVPYLLFYQVSNPQSLNTA